VRSVEQGVRGTDEGGERLPQLLGGGRVESRN
jgi:hypothetical protein